MKARDYDSTVARIAGNILSGRERTTGWNKEDADAMDVAWAVGMARAIIAEVRRTEPKEPS